MTVSAEDDFARKHLFSIGRKLTWLFRPSFQDNLEAELWGTALGEFEPQQTHELKLNPSPSTIDDSLYKDCAINKKDFTESLILGGAQLTPKPGRHQPYSPVVVAYTSHKLVQNHNGIFGKIFSDFLTDYVAFVEGKRMCLVTEMLSHTAK